MQKSRLTKTLSMDIDIVRIIEKKAREENRSFTGQAELMLKKYLENNPCTDKPPMDMELEAKG
jgi:hypothetical protein